MSENKRPRHYPTNSNDEPPYKKLKKNDKSAKPIQKKKDDNVEEDKNVNDSETVYSESPSIDYGYDSWG